LSLDIKNRAHISRHFYQQIKLFPNILISGKLIGPKLTQLHWLLPAISTEKKRKNGINETQIP
jgi:hypothetical protein